MGEDTWQRWLDAMRVKGIKMHVKYEPCNRQFRFGNNKVLVSKRTVTFIAKPFGADKEMTVNLVPGATPMLVARTCLEDWGLIVDFSAGAASLKDHPETGWRNLERDEKGHYILDLLGIGNFDAIINPPQAAILAIGTITKQPVVNAANQIVPGQRMWIGMSCDHRVIDGAVGARFLSELKRFLETPILLIS